MSQDIYIHVCTNPCIHAYADTPFTHISIYGHINTCHSLHIPTHAHIYSYIHTHMYNQTYIQVDIHIYVHINICLHVCMNIPFMYVDAHIHTISTYLHDASRHIYTNTPFTQIHTHKHGPFIHIHTNAPQRSLAYWIGPRNQIAFLSKVK